MPPEEHNISVVIPLFNKENFVEKAIRSVIGQKSYCKEIIVVDDGSTDNSIEIVKRFDEKVVRIISQPNMGVAGARNTGIEQATGEWIAFLDADDEWEPGFLDKISELIKTYPNCVGAGTSYYLGFQPGNRNNIHLNAISFQGEKGMLTNYFEVATQSDPPICSSSVCIRKQKIDEIGGFPVGIKIGEDLLTWARLAALGNFAYCTTPMATFWQVNTGVDRTPPSRIPDPDDLVGKELRTLYKSYAGVQKKWLKRYIGLWHKMRASIYLRLGMGRPALKEIILSLKNSYFSSTTLAYFALLLMPKRLRKGLFRRFAAQPHLS